MTIRVGTSGYSFTDWIGPFYPTRVRDRDMFTYYTGHFDTVEINYTFYRMPSPRTLTRLQQISPDGFSFWVKAYRTITHEYQPADIPAFVAALAPLREAGKLAGVLLQFPQSFHRTPDTRRYLQRVTQTFHEVPLAVELRHYTWQHPATLASLRKYGHTLVVPDVPEIPALYQTPPVATSRTGYVRLHSRNAANWYDAGVDRYDYDYTPEQLRALLQGWRQLEDQLDQVYTFFNNCHSGQAARNAEAFRRLLEEPGAGP